MIENEENMASLKGSVKKKTVFGYELTLHQDAWLNYLVPSISACLLYILLIASDCAVIFRHYKNGDSIWGSLTLFFMYLPVLGSFFIIVSNWDLWPEYEGCGRDNMIWFWVKSTEHLLFPAWSMWRYAERIFWSIEAVRAKDDNSIQEMLTNLNSPRSIELYIFLQSYVHSLPQVLLQFYILIRLNTNIVRETAEVQVISIVCNLVKLAITTTYYQRFRSQKLTGKQYPWFKKNKVFQQAPEEQVILRRPPLTQRSVIKEKRNTSNLEDSYSLEPPKYYSERRRSSDIYLEPASSEGEKRQTLLETDFDEDIVTKVKPREGIDEVDRTTELPPYSDTTPGVLRETSIVDGPKRNVFRETGISDRSEPDFNISRVITVKGLEEDDIAGTLVSNVWWFSFLLTRVLAISMFAYFFFNETIWLLICHYVFIISILIYDVKTDAVKRSKAFFFLFIGYVYMFCIIEFKIRFKKATQIYYGFFALVSAENLGMCLAWYIKKIEYLENDFWFRYAFYIVIIGTITSFSSMMFYFILNKPKKVVVEKKTLSTRSSNY